ncbi:hypothetical protein HQ48_06560 [Porphyromonas sp. COT-290 OH3588]|nr:hypothetical protein HQ48_06560 [Porphyromonas sp. COT-290 OH3588]
MNRQQTYKLFFSVAGLLMIASCSRPITKTLFLQSGRPHIYLPTNKEEKSGGILSERVSYETKIDTIRPAHKPALDDEDMKSVTLETFTVVADRPKLKISTVRNGKINLTFLMTVPKAFMDNRWQIVLTPHLINGDQTSALPPVVLKGSQFKKVQDEEFAKFAKFEKDIIDPSDYDKKFFDQKKHSLFTKNLQHKYLDHYTAEYKRLQDYQAWKHIAEVRIMNANARREGRYYQRLNDKAIEMLGSAYNDDLYGLDSSKVHRGFSGRYNEEHRKNYLDKKLSTLTVDKVPKNYRKYFEKNFTLDSLKNKSLTEKDSANIAKHTYFFKDIAQNESKIKNKDTHRRHLVRFPEVENPALSDSIRTGKDFVYLYSQDIDVTEDLQRKLSVIVETRVTAMDQSSWHQGGVDTLNFIVSGMNDLVDKTLISRLDEADQAIYQQGLDRLAVRDYRGALNIINQYPDYNSAVCLAALGYNDQAIMLLDRITATGKADYLRAIVYARMKKLEEAKESLLSAARKESTLAFKVEIEPEFAVLLETYPELQEQLENIGDGLDEM